MRFSAVLSLVAVVAAAAVATANEPPRSPQQLGAASAVFDFCSRVDHDGDRIFDAGSELLYHGLTRREIEQIKHSDAFRQAYATLESVLSELPAKDAHAACEAIGPATLAKYHW
jgi:hypothetical protein